MKRYVIIYLVDLLVIIGLILVGCEQTASVTIPATGGGAGISDEEYSENWSGVTDYGASKNVLYNKFESLGGSTAMLAVRSYTRDASTASGDVSYTGYGFVPDMIIMDGYWYEGGSISHGSGTDAVNYMCAIANKGTTVTGVYPKIAKFIDASNNQQVVGIKSMDADGFTLTWTKTGTLTGTIYYWILAVKE